MLVKGPAIDGSRGSSNREITSLTFDKMAVRTFMVTRVNSCAYLMSTKINKEKKEIPSFVKKGNAPSAGAEATAEAKGANAAPNLLNAVVGAVKGALGLKFVQTKEKLIKKFRNKIKIKKSFISLSEKAPDTPEGDDKEESAVEETKSDDEEEEEEDKEKISDDEMKKLCTVLSGECPDFAYIPIVREIQFICPRNKIFISTEGIFNSDKTKEIAGNFSICMRFIV